MKFIFLILFKEICNLKITKKSKKKEIYNLKMIYKIQQIHFQKSISASFNPMELALNIGS